MNKILTMALSALMVLALFAMVSPASAQEDTVDSVEIRGPVFNGTEFTNSENAVFGCTTNPGEVLEMNTSNFAGFFYDLDDNEGEEKIEILEKKTSNPRTIEEDGLRYVSSKFTDEPTYEFVKEDGSGDLYNYSKVGFLAEEYVAVDGNVDVLSKVLMDDDTSRTMRTGETLELAEGYAITPQQIDVDGNKVWLELTKDGEFVDDKIINVGNNANESDKTWYYEQDDVGGEDDIKTLLIHVDEVFQGQVDSLAVIDGVWQISDTAMEIETDDTFGKLAVDSVSDGQIKMSLDDSITLNADDTYEVTDMINLKVADSDTIRYYPYVEKTIAGEEPAAEAPTAAFSASPMSGNAPLEVTFTDESENAENYEWDFGNGETSTEANPTTTYEEAGEYTVTLTVSNDAGEDTAEETITVNPEGTPEEPEMPTADFSANTTSGTAPLTVEFTDNSENAENYEWDFGNGETSTDANPTTTYEEAGEYTVTLTVSNDAGEDTAETTITVDAAEEPGDGEGNGVPGFEAVFAIAGLLAIAFLVRRNRN